MKKKDSQSEPDKIKFPLDIALSLLTPDELEKLKKYIIFYVEKYGLEDEAEEQDRAPFDRPPRSSDTVQPTEQ